jgi:hypothetical protein
MRLLVVETKSYTCSQRLTPILRQAKRHICTSLLSGPYSSQPIVNEPASVIYYCGSRCTSLRLATTPPRDACTCTYQDTLMPGSLRRESHANYYDPSCCCIAHTIAPTDVASQVPSANPVFAAGLTNWSYKVRVSFKLSWSVTTFPL